MYTIRVQFGLIEIRQKLFARINHIENVPERAINNLRRSDILASGLEVFEVNDMKLFRIECRGRHYTLEHANPDSTKNVLLLKKSTILIQLL